jgi:aspartyl-tRNA(Asn)/glutamyl-tRNA(Gln) amidotransferase subunit B
MRLLLTYLGVSDCNMQEGSLRCDANINLHIPRGDGHVATPIVEVKNMNSFRAVERALTYEALRQYEWWQETGIELGAPGGHKTTRGWDEQAQVTKAQRQKEESSDYRYFPDPDLVPVRVTEEMVEQTRQELGELPAAIRRRLQDQYQLDAYDADVLVNQGRGLVDYYETVAEQSGDPKRASNWVQQDVLRTLKERQMTIDQFPVPAVALAEMLKAIHSGKLPSARAPDAFQEMLTGKTVPEAMKSLGIEQVDRATMTGICRALLEANPRIVEDVKSGKTKALGALIGQAKKQNPNADPNEVRTICLELIEDM